MGQNARLGKPKRKKRDEDHDSMIYAVRNRETENADRIHVMRWMKCEVGDVGPSERDR